MDLKIENHIKELLWDHDCVIVSGLGAFVLNKKGASIDEVTGKIEPPKKIISFNSRIKQNDGLLANHIAKENEISYEEACLQIALFTKKIIFKIQKNEKFVLDLVGELRLESGKVIFTPHQKTNYDKNSFGLKSFYLPKRKKSAYILYKQELRVAATLIIFLGISFFFFSKYNKAENTNLSNISSFLYQENKTNIQEESDSLFEKAGLYNLQVSQIDYDLYNINGTNYHVTTKKCFKIGYGINAQIKIYDQGKKRKREICFPDISGSGYTDCYNIKDVYNKLETSSGELVVMDKKGRMRKAVLVFEETILDYQTLVNSKPLEFEEENTDLTSRFINAVNSLSNNNTEKNDEVIFVPIKKETEKINITNNTYNNQNIENGFFIIVGSFSTKQNAQKLVNELIRKGFKSASLAGKSSSNLFRVSCSKYQTEKIAKKELEKLKLEFNGAWVLNGYSN